ncbi:MAG TPA: GNAT family N-acetyltransferase [Candidatus Saccharimonadales bacterium]|nr:GNAT family N-acetyltransferase [Candidatus Saccharimonadales bacterium]
MNEKTTFQHGLEGSLTEIIRAVPNDAEVICSIRDAAWMGTYPNEELGITLEDVRINAQGLNGEFVPRRIAWFKQKIAEDDENWVAYVGKIDNDVRGFVVASRNDEGRRLVNSIYVEPGFQGKGLGRKLMDKALDWLGGEEDIYFEVASYNDAAIRFYERFGFEKTENKVEEEPDRPSYITPIPQIEMILKPASNQIA